MMYNINTNFLLGGIKLITTIECRTKRYDEVMETKYQLQEKLENLQLIGFDAENYVIVGGAEGKGDPWANVVNSKVLRMLISELRQITSEENISILDAIFNDRRYRVFKLYDEYSKLERLYKKYKEAWELKGELIFQLPLWEYKTSFTKIEK